MTLTDDFLGAMTCQAALIFIEENTSFAKIYYEILIQFIAVDVFVNNRPRRRPQHRGRQDHEKLYFNPIVDAKRGRGTARRRSAVT